MAQHSSDAPRVLPRHIGFIMDGNGRWAKKRALLRTAGHYRGAEVFQDIVRHCEKVGIEAATFYAFSTENWSRAAEEVNALMNLLRRYLDDALGFKDENIRIRFIGNRDRLSSDLVKKMEHIEEVSAKKTGLFLIIAVDYGGREEILRAAACSAAYLREKGLPPQDLDQALFSSFLYTVDAPPLDLVIRTSGEQRLSNFMLWQAAYSELLFVDRLWPDMTGADVDAAIDEYGRRTRRFGG